GRCAGVKRLLVELHAELKDYQDRRGGIVVGDTQEGATVSEKVLVTIHSIRCHASAGGEEEASDP
ncbi:MAG: hypothetical protein QF464_19420, partial [Myxococcota bacterium]|nr:hypothetical protein [Myxococcota bacterium]